MVLADNFIINNAICKILLAVIFAVTTYSDFVVRTKVTSDNHIVKEKDHCFGALRKTKLTCENTPLLFDIQGFW